MISLVVYHTALTQPGVDERVPPLSISDCPHLAIKISKCFIYNSYESFLSEVSGVVNAMQSKVSSLRATGLV